ncbi:hypothetical protein ACFLSJ_05890, partial [Verrucomicrobiota bacterium]
MRLSPRESVLLLATAGAALYGGTGVLARPRVEEWKELRQKQRTVMQEIDLDQRLVDSRVRWARKIMELRRMMPQYPPDKKMDVYWLSVMDNVAAGHDLRIARRQVGEEQNLGDIYELPIRCRDW